MNFAMALMHKCRHFPIIGLFSDFVPKPSMQSVEDWIWKSGEHFLWLGKGERHWMRTHVKSSASCALKRRILSSHLYFPFRLSIGKNQTHRHKYQVLTIIKAEISIKIICPQDLDLEKLSKILAHERIGPQKPAATANGKYRGRRADEKSSLPRFLVLRVILSNARL